MTREALFLGIGRPVQGKRLSDISHAVQSHAEWQDFPWFSKFVGHGIGKDLHEDPQIPNYGKPGVGIRLEARHGVRH